MDFLDSGGTAYFAKRGDAMEVLLVESPGIGAAGGSREAPGKATRYAVLVLALARCSTPCDEVGRVVCGDGTVVRRDRRVRCISWKNRMQCSGE